MPRRREKTRCLADVTVGLFADAPEVVGRPAKRISDRRSVACRLAAEAAGEAADPAEVADEDDDDVIGEVEVDADTAAVGRRGRKRRPAVVGGSATYPSLLWQLLGRHIHPEAVGTFAALCRDTHRVTRTRAFWRCLYLRWAWGPAAAADDSAPHELRRLAILGCHRAVRPRVIRALHRWHFAPAATPLTLQTQPPPAGLRFLRFAVRGGGGGENGVGRRILVLFRRGPPPPPPRPVPDTWEAEAAAATGDAADEEERCQTEGQWLLTAELDSGGGCPPSTCLAEDLLGLDGRYVLEGIRCLTVCGGAGGGGAKGAGGGRFWCELQLRAAHGESRVVGFACAGGARLLPWWRPGFLAALRER